MINAKEIRLNEVRQDLIKHMVSPHMTSEKAVELYCFIHKKWGYVKYDKNGHNPVAVIQERDDS
jgi:hypothetical protein